MTIWLLALLLVASVAALGYRQGAIRVAFSFVGILIGALLAVPLGNLIKPILKIFGLKNPVLIYLLAPVIIFIIFSIIFKLVAAPVHHKVDVYYKYKAGDLRLALWERLNHCLGLCLGLANGVLYVILLAFAIFPLSYATAQIASSDEDPRWMRVLNTLGRDLQSTGFSRVARALDHRTVWYQAADLAGLLYQNPLLEARVARYPAFLGLSERQEFKDIGAEKLRERGQPVMSLLETPKFQVVLDNPDLLKEIWSTLVPDIRDFADYLRSGRSAKYDQELILGRWNFDVNQAMVFLRRARPNMSSKEAQAMKSWLAKAYATTSMVAMTDHKVILKNWPSIRQPAPTAPNAPPPAAPPTQNVTGQWQGAGNNYEISFSGSAPSKVSVEGDRLKMNFDTTDAAFIREL